MMNCPYCGSRVANIEPLPLSRRQSIIYREVASAGESGIEPEDLIEAVWGKRPTKGADIMLRVQIHELNKVLADYGKRVVAKGGRRWLVAQ